MLLGIQRALGMGKGLDDVKIVDLLETQDLEHKDPEKLSKVTQRFYTQYIKINILQYLNHCVFGPP